MAETPARYCSNCGQELGDPGQQFCPNCGSPVHRTAHVPTPEADVPVSPAPQAWNTGMATQGQPPPGSEGQRRPVRMGCLGLLVLVFLLFIIGGALGGGDETAGGDGNGGGGGNGGGAANNDAQISAGDGNNEAEEPEPQNEEPQAEKKPEPKPKPEPKYTVGQTAQAGNVEWKVTDAFLTDQLKSNFGTQKRGNFVVIDFAFTNNRPDEVTLDPELHMILKDSQGREFGSDPDAWEFVPTDLMIFLEPVNPGVGTEGRVVYEVAPDATAFTLTLDDVEMMEDKSAVFDLGNLSSQVYDPSSASASASASPAAGQ